MGNLAGHSGSYSELAFSGDKFIEDQLKLWIGTSEACSNLPCPIEIFDLTHYRPIGWWQRQQVTQVTNFIRKLDQLGV